MVLQCIRLSEEVNLKSLHTVCFHLCNTLKMTEYKKQEQMNVARKIATSEGWCKGIDL